MVQRAAQGYAMLHLQPLLCWQLSSAPGLLCIFRGNLFDDGLLKGFLALRQLTTKGLSHTSGGDSDQDKIASLFNHGAAALPAPARPPGLALSLHNGTH